jgi:hypothetical protein
MIHLTRMVGRPRKQPRIGLAMLVASVALAATLAARQFEAADRAARRAAWSRLQPTMYAVDARSAVSDCMLVQKRK